MKMHTYAEVNRAQPNDVYVLAVSLPASKEAHPRRHTQGGTPKEAQPRRHTQGGTPKEVSAKPTLVTPHGL